MSEVQECLRDRCSMLSDGFALVRVDDSEERRHVLRTKCHVLARELGLTEEDRHELSVMVVGKDVSPSWRTFKYPDLCRLADMLSGAGYFVVIIRDRRRQ